MRLIYLYILYFNSPNYSINYIDMVILVDKSHFFSSSDEMIMPLKTYTYNGGIRSLYSVHDIQPNNFDIFINWTMTCGHNLKIYYIVYKTHFIISTINYFLKYMHNFKRHLILNRGEYDFWLYFCYYIFYLSLGITIDLYNKVME